MFWCSVHEHRTILLTEYTKVILEEFLVKITGAYATIIKISKAWWLRYLKLKMNLLFPLWIPCLKGEMNLTAFVIFKIFWQKKKNCVLWSWHKLSGLHNYSLLTENIKEVVPLELFQREVKNWICEDFPCKLCKPYLQNIGFL